MMRVFVVVVLMAGLLAGSAVAAPVPKSLKKLPPVTLTMTQSESGPISFTVTISNHTDAPITWRSTTISLAAFALELTDESGRVVPTTHPAALHSPFGTLQKVATVEPGNDYLMGFRLDTMFFGQERPAGKLKLTATFEHDGKTYQSDPLQVR